MSIMCLESIFRDIRRTYVYLMVPSSQILLGKIEGIVRLVQHVFNSGNKKSIFTGRRVECAIICAKVPVAILFLHQEYR